MGKQLLAGSQLLLAYYYVLDCSLRRTARCGVVHKALVIFGETAYLV